VDNLRYIEEVTIELSVYKLERSERGFRVNIILDDPFDLLMGKIPMLLYDVGDYGFHLYSCFISVPPNYFCESMRTEFNLK